MSPTPKELRKEQDKKLKDLLANWYIVNHLGAEPDEENLHTSYEARQFAEDIFEEMLETIGEDPDGDFEEFDEDGDPMTDEEDEWERENPYD